MMWQVNVDAYISHDKERADELVVVGWSQTPNEEKPLVIPMQAAMKYTNMTVVADVIFLLDLSIRASALKIVAVGTDNSRYTRY